MLVTKSFLQFFSFSNKAVPCTKFQTKSADFGHIFGEMRVKKKNKALLRISPINVEKCVEAMKMIFYADILMQNCPVLQQFNILTNLFRNKREKCFEEEV